MKKILNTLLALMLLVVGFTGCMENNSDVVENGVEVDVQEVNETTESEVVEASLTDITYVLTDSGQTKAYGLDGKEIEAALGEDLYGQDADYAGVEASFTDNGDGTVTDNVTALMWQKLPESGNISWDEAIEYAENLECAGYDDWRLPTAKELFGIGDFSTGWPYLDTNYFDFPETTAIPEGMEGPSGGPQGGPSVGEDAEMMPPSGDEGGDMPPPPPVEEGDGISKMQGQFWSSNFYFVGKTHGDADTAFGVNHATGHIKGYPSEVGGMMGKHVRAVRGDITAENNFVDNGDGTISDLATGLMWMMDDNGAGVEWTEALSYCEDLEFAGHDDWRLPNVKELQSIVDYSGVYPAIDDTYFKCTELAENINYYFWTSTSAYFSTGEPDYFYAWYVAFGKAVGEDGEDVHGAGAVRFSAKYEASSAFAEGGDNFMNSVRAVRLMD